MADLTTINITYESPGVQASGFAVPLIASTHAIGATRIQTFSGTAAAILGDMVTAGHATTTDAWKQANALLAQNTPSSIKVGKILAGDADYGVGMTAILAEDSTGWYTCCIDSRDEAEIAAVSAVIEPTDHLFVAVTNDADDLTGTGGAVAANQTALRKRTVYGHRDPSTEDYADAALLGVASRANLDVRDGQIDWSANGLTGVVPDTITGAEKAQVHTYSGWTYTTEHGKGITRHVFNGFGWPAEAQMAVDVVKTRVAEAAFNLIYGKAIVGMDAQGLTDLEGAVRGALQTLQNNGALVSFTVRNGGLQEVTSPDRAAGVVRVISFDAVIRIGIKQVVIPGRVAL